MAWQVRREGSGQDAECGQNSQRQNHGNRKQRTREGVDSRQVATSNAVRCAQKTGMAVEMRTSANPAGICARGTASTPQRRNTAGESLHERKP